MIGLVKSSRHGYLAAVNTLTPSFWQRLAIAWRLLFDVVFALRVQRLDAPTERPTDAPTDAPANAPLLRAEPPPAQIADSAAALQLLALLQREGRFVDFLQEDVASASDQDIGAAARVVHEGCRRALKDVVKIEPVRSEAEGAPIVLERGFDATRHRVTGHVVGEPPFKGRLAHHGWLVLEIKLPALTAGHDPKIVAPAEVEL